MLVHEGQPQASMSDVRSFSFLARTTSCSPYMRAARFSTPASWPHSVPHSLTLRRWAAAGPRTAASSIGQAGRGRWQWRVQDATPLAGITAAINSPPFRMQDGFAYPGIWMDGRNDALGGVPSMVCIQQINRPHGHGRISCLFQKCLQLPTETVLLTWEKGRGTRRRVLLLSMTANCTPGQRTGTNDRNATMAISFPPTDRTALTALSMPNILRVRPGGGLLA